jgi:hypothetical protein
MDGSKSNLLIKVCDESILHILEKSINSLHSLRRNQSSSPSKLKTSLRKSYNVKIKAMNYFLQKNFFKQSENQRTNYFAEVPQEKLYDSSVKDYSLVSYEAESPEIKRKFSDNRIDRLIRTNHTKSLAKKIDFDGKSENNTTATLTSSKNESFLKAAQKRIQKLAINKDVLENTVKKIENKLYELSSNHVKKQNTMLDVLNKLEKIENTVQKSNNADVKVLEAVKKISAIENNCLNIKYSSEDCLKNFKNEMKEVNSKLIDLKECTKILNELTICLKQNPTDKTSEKTMETISTEESKYNTVQTISLSKLMNSDLVLKELFEQKEKLTKEREKMETEYKKIPPDSRSMANKRKKQALELDLSMNYTKFMSITNKIKKYTN